MIARAGAAMMLALFALSTPQKAAAAQGPDTNLRDDCYEDLEKGTRPEIACRVPLRLSETERAELEKGSRGYVKDVTCDMTVRIPRSDIETAIASRDVVFQSPEQPVRCTISGPKNTLDITATFAPRVVIKNDIAVEATPGLGNVKGITRVISWPVVAFVNRWPSIRSGMLQVVNAYRTHVRKEKAKSGPAAPQ